MPAGFDAATSFDDQPIRVNGQRVTPESGGKDLIYVPLTGLNSDEPFLLEIRYTIPGDPNQIDLPLFVDEPAVQKVYLCVYLPFERALLHRSGDWTDVAVDEHTNSIAGLLSSGSANSIASRVFQTRTEYVEQYLNWVQSGINFDSSASQKFEVDGRPYVFSALRPNPAPAGSLHLRTINLTVLNVIVFGAIAILGLMLARTRFTTQITGAMFVTAALVAVGVFFPLVTEHLFSEALLLTVGVVGLTCLTSNVIRWFREIKNVRRERQILNESQQEVSTVNAVPVSTIAPEATESVGSDDSPPDSAATEEGESQ
jgi:hypothetical protein